MGYIMLFPALVLLAACALQPTALPVAMHALGYDVTALVWNER